jgi:hypothetical protein
MITNKTTNATLQTFVMNRVAEFFIIMVPHSLLAGGLITWTRVESRFRECQQAETPAVLLTSDSDVSPRLSPSVVALALNSTRNLWLQRQPAATWQLCFVGFSSTRVAGGRGQGWRRRIQILNAAEFTMVSNAELDRLIAELRTHPLAEGELRQVKEGLYVSLSQSQPEGFEYAFCLSSGGRMYFFFRKAG